MRGLCFIKGEQLVAWGNERTIKVWDIETGKLLLVILDEETKPLGVHSVMQVGVSPDGGTLVYTGGQRSSKDSEKWVDKIYFWSLKERKPRGEIELTNTNHGQFNYSCPILSHDSKYFAWPERVGTLQLYRSANLEKVRSLGEAFENGWVKDACFSGDGKTLAVLTQKQTIRLLDVATGRELREIGEGTHCYDRYLWGRLYPICRPIRLAWSPDSKMIAQVWGRGVIRTWGPRDGQRQ